jgi:outer membrane murein-binding lipoprotein Lpp
MDKNALQQVLSSANWWMGVSTIAVAVGILGEYVAHFIFEEDARRNKREMAVSILFGVLVLGGVVGEYVFGKKLSQVSEQLQQLADAEVAQSNKDAAQARRDAETAKQEAAQLRKDAETERLARVKIEASVAWRHLTDAQKKDIGKALSRFSNEVVGVQYEIAGSDCSSFAADIAEALTEVRGLHVQPPTGQITATYGKQGQPIRRIGTGVIVQSTNDAGSRSLAEGIIHELMSRGFDATRQKDPPFGTNSAPTVWVEVVLRPEGAQGEYKLQAERDAKAKNKSKAK